MREPPDAVERERDLLKGEVKMLAQQLKHLVKAEHALTRARRESERQLERIKRLADFAFDITGVEARSAVLAEARAALLDQFDLDDAAVLQLSPDLPRVQCEAAVLDLPDGTFGVLNALTRAVVLEPAAEAAATALEALGALGLPPATPPRVVALIPIRPGAGQAAALLLAWSSRGHAHHRDVPRPEHAPFLQLFADHVTRALDSAHFTSEQRQHAAALGQANQRLQKSLADLERTQGQLMQAQKLEALGRLAGGIAHDFNNLLTVIISHADLTRDAVQDHPEAREDLSIIVDAATRATEITKRLLAFGRKQEHRQQIVDLNAAATDLSRMLRRLIGDDIVLQLDLDPGVGRVKVDAVHLEQVLLNLVVNARDAMPKGGKLTLETRRARQSDRSGEGGVPTANLIALSVKDTGIGMDEATRSQLFEPFFTTKPMGKGTGLGLATVYGLVTQNAGEVKVTSKAGEGSCFTVLLPSAEGISGAVEAPAPKRRGAVLVVEDEDAIRRMVARVLRRSGFEVVEVRHGEEALEAARRLPKLDLVVTDVVMPVMGGPALVKELRATLPHVKVVFMSGHTFDRLDVGTLDPRGERFLAKPFTPDQLNGAVDQALGASALMESGQAA